MPEPARIINDQTTTTNHQETTTMDTTTNQPEPYAIPDGLEAHTDAIREAHAMGLEAGRNAGSWSADGNTTADHARNVLRMLDDGDPAAWDYLPREPNLSGEWGSHLTPDRLAHQLLDESTLDGLYPRDLATDLVDALADAWEAGVSETFSDACERELRTHWGPVQALEAMGVAVIIGPGRIIIDATRDALHRWADARDWPVSVLRDLDGLHVELDGQTGDLSGLELAGLHYCNQDGRYYARLDQDGDPYPQDMADAIELEGAELSAFLADHLAHVMEPEHPAYHGAVGQHDPEPVKLDQ